MANDKKILKGTATTAPAAPKVKMKTGVANMAGKAKDKPASKPTPLVKVKAPAVNAPARVGNKAGKDNIVDHITKNFRVTAREARDIVTAVSSVGKAALSTAKGGDAFALKATAKNLPTQVKEAAKAAVTGKAGTTPMETVSPSSRKSGAAYTATQSRTNTLPKKKAK